MKKTLLIAFAILVVAGTYYFFQESRSPFNREIWLSSKHCKPVQEADKRLPMFKDVVASLKNKSREDIVHLLGEPDPESVLPNVKKDMVYCLGRSYGLSMNWLIIHLDQKGTFAGHEILKAD